MPSPRPRAPGAVSRAAGAAVAAAVSVRRGHLRAAIASGVLVLVSVLWLATGLGGPRATAAFSYCVQLTVVVFSAGAAGFAARRLAGIQRLAWAAIAAGLSMAAVSTAIDAVQTVVHWAPCTGAGAVVWRPCLPANDFASVFDLLEWPAVAAGAVCMLLAYVSAGRLRTALDAFIVGGGLLLVVRVTVLHDTTAGATAPLIELNADIGYAVLLASLMLRARPQDRLPLALLAASVCTDTISSVLGAVAVMHPGAPARFDATGSPLDLVPIAGGIAITLAALCVRPAVARAQHEIGERSIFVAFLPYLGVIAAAVSAGAQQVMHGAVDAVVTLDGTLILFLLSLRQLLALHENRALTGDLERRRAELAASEERFRELVQNSSDVVVVLDAHGVMTFVSPALANVLGIEPEEFVGQPLTAVVHGEDREAVGARLGTLAGADRNVPPLEFRVMHRNGGWRSLEAVPTNLLQSARVNGIVLNTRDVTDRRELEEQLRFKAFHDPLTGLANRMLLRDRVAHAQHRARRSGEQIALLFIDLDDFKMVNDSLGHASGDELLRTVSGRVLSCLRATDTAARLGGDEFAVLIEGMQGNEAEQIATRILSRLDEPVALGDAMVKVRCSIGIAPGWAGSDADDLLRCADVAMYRAKAKGKGDYATFHPSMEQVAHERLQFQAEFSRALEEDELVLHYQPVIDLRDGRLMGVEALVRWNHPERGLLAPTDFIEAAEETGLVVPLGRWVLGTACRQTRAWNEQFGDLEVAVNISARHVQSLDFVSDVMGVLEDTGLEPRNLLLELTESALLGDIVGSCVRLASLKEMGVRVALDDFGTGYSSLGYLRDLPVDILKIDRSFLSQLGDGDEHTEFVRAICTLSRSLRLVTIAEGIETTMQLDVLRALEVDLAQGYLFSQPVTAERLGQLLPRRRFDMGPARREPRRSLRARVA